MRLWPDILHDLFSLRLFMCLHLSIFIKISFYLVHANLNQVKVMWNLIVKFPNQWKLFIILNTFTGRKICHCSSCVKFKRSKIWIFIPFIPFHETKIQDFFNSFKIILDVYFEEFKYFSFSLNSLNNLKIKFLADVFCFVQMINFLKDFIAIEKII